MRGESIAPANKKLKPINEVSKMVDQSTNRDQLADLVKDSTEKNRQFFVLYLGLLTYVLLMVAGTTDLMLLVPTQGIKLPLIDVTLPLIPFYIIAPLFLLAIHFNLLQNLESHHFKLMRWRDSCGDEGVPREEINAFLFDYEWLEQNSKMRTLLRFSSRILFLQSGPFALGVLLWRFTDYQDIVITTFHLLIFLADSYLVWLTTKAFTENEQPAQTQQASMTAGFWKNLLHKVQKATNKILKTYYGLSYWAKLLNFIKQLSTLTLYILKTLKFRFFGTLVILQFLLACWFQVSSDSFIDGWRQLEGQNDKNWFANFTTTVKTKLPWLHSIVIPIISIDSNETVWLPNKGDLEIKAMLAEEKDTQKWWQKQGEGLDLTGRHLRGLSAPGIHFPKLKLYKPNSLSVADLSGANLSGAQLRNSDLSQALLQGANLTFTELEGAKMSGTRLDHAILEGANLRYVCAMQGHRI